MRAKMRVDYRFAVVEGQDSTVGVSDNELHGGQIRTFTRQPQISISYWRDGRSGVVNEKCRAKWELGACWPRLRVQIGKLRDEI